MTRQVVDRHGQEITAGARVRCRKLWDGDGTFHDHEFTGTVTELMDGPPMLRIDPDDHDGEKFFTYRRSGGRWTAVSHGKYGTEWMEVVD